VGQLPSPQVEAEEIQDLLMFKYLSQAEPIRPLLGWQIVLLFVLVAEDRVAEVRLRGFQMVEEEDRAVFLNPM
jgi:hypothetical protein